jgi:hypothetical protein
MSCTAQFDFEPNSRRENMKTITLAVALFAATASASFAGSSATEDRLCNFETYGSGAIHKMNSDQNTGCFRDEAGDEAAFMAGQGRGQRVPGGSNSGINSGGNTGGSGNAN